ncbi:hypothetical protein O0L34_g4949 [Tuta absoluta]|nr:hypothetical protein O0L34_g4949 [Tuta absoluta]
MGDLRTKLLIGATFDDNAVTAWFSNFGYHDVANSLAAVHEAMLKAFKPEANLTVYNYPLEATYANQRNMQLLVALMSMQLAQGIGASIGVVAAVFIMFYIKERASRAKLLQKAAGIQPVVMWGSAALFDWLLFSFVCVLIIISCLIFNVVGLSTAGELGRAYLCIIICCAAMLPINYVFSYFFKGPAAGFMSIYFLNVLIGLLTSQIVNALSSPMLTTKHIADILDNILQFFPLYSLVTVVRIQVQHALLVDSCLSGCEYLTAVRPGADCTMQYICENLSQQCCVEEFSWWDWEQPGLMRYITCMIVTWAVMWVILMIAEYRLVQKVFNREKKAPPLEEDKLDADVLDEAKHALSVGKGEGQGVSLTAQGLTKYYGKHLAVDQVSFTVGDTECFGLLGVNGAGKTTTFKMLMGDESISSGDAFVGGHSVKTNITRVHEQIGYCPQFDAVFPELTGRETLRLFACLRGLPRDQWMLESLALAHALGFTKHLDKPVSAYSGGNKRKLSTAVSLLGRTRLVFVDEPTTGVDPAAKRRVWSALQAIRRLGRGVVLTSHSMEECEALCSRLTIMVNGRFQCLGTPQHLKNKFSQGFTLIVKMRVDSTTNTVSQEMSNAVKRYVSSHFENPKIMEEYNGLITYYLSDSSMPWSRMFGVLERAKRQVGVEAYTISQTTLEQIFLQFTKYQREQR